MKTKRTMSALLTALLLTLCLGASALTITNEDVQYPSFPWKDYMLNMALCTDDPKEVDDGQANLMVKFICLSGDGEIAYSDIEQAGEKFFLRDQNGTEHPPVSFRVRGVSFKDGKFSTHEKQKGFELLFALPEGTWNTGLALLVGEKEARERPIVQLLP